MAIQVQGAVPRRSSRPTAGRHLATHARVHALPAATIALKVLVVAMMLRVLLDPAWANLEGKAPVARAVLFPLLTLAVPAFWLATRRATAYPWVADLLVTLTCFADVAGNRLDLYDALEWFDDAMHLANTAVVSAVFVVLTVPAGARAAEVVNAAIAAGLTASLVWELFEYGSFLTRSTEWTTAYSDTVGDIVLGWLGAVLAAAVVTLTRTRTVRRRGARR